MDNRITGITFIRKNKELIYDKNENCIILHLEKDIPSLGYGAKEIRKMLKATIVKKQK